MLKSWTRSPREPLLRQRMSWSLVPDLVRPSCQGRYLRRRSHLVVNRGVEVLRDDIAHNGRLGGLWVSGIGLGLSGSLSSPRNGSGLGVAVGQAIGLGSRVLFSFDGLAWLAEEASDLGGKRRLLTLDLSGSAVSFGGLEALLFLRTKALHQTRTALGVDWTLLGDGGCLSSGLDSCGSNWVLNDLFCSLVLLDLRLWLDELGFLFLEESLNASTFLLLLRSGRRLLGCGWCFRCGLLNCGWGLNGVDWGNNCSSVQWLLLNGLLNLGCRLGNWWEVTVLGWYSWTSFALGLLSIWADDVLFAEDTTENRSTLGFLIGFLSWCRSTRLLLLFLFVLLLGENGGSWNYINFS